MKLLIITQKVDLDDPILGFFHRWIEEFSKHYEKLTVICLQKGKYSFPENVKVLSLSKESGKSRFKYLYRFYKYIWQERKNYDAVFVHMNPAYCSLGFPVWFVCRKLIYLWYNHKQVDLKLRLSLLFCRNIFTASSKSFNIKTSKLRVVGHGVDLSQFNDLQKKLDFSQLKILHVGRVTRIKNIETLVRAISIVKDEVSALKVQLVGGPITSDDLKYVTEIKNLISNLTLEKYISFVDSVPYYKIKDYYNWATVTVNMTFTGGVDKAVLESMASSTPVLSSNESFLPYFDAYNGDLIFKYGDYRDLAAKIVSLVNKREVINDIGCYLKVKVGEMASVENLTVRISKIIKDEN